MSQLTLNQARKIIASALADARQRNTHPMGVVVLDAGGHLKAAEREDGASMFRIDIAQGKAWAALAMGVNSRQLVKRAADNPAFYGALCTTGQGRFIPQVGAVLIVDETGTVLGAVGASGDAGEQDEAICIAGVKEAGLSVYAAVP